MSENKTHHIEEIHPHIVHIDNGEGKPLCNTSRPNPKMVHPPDNANCRSCNKRWQR